MEPKVIARSADEQRGRLLSRRVRWILNAIIVAVMVVLIAGGLYVGNYYHADSYVLSGENDKGAELVVEANDDYAIFAPASENAFERGIVFYPGAKVEYTAYGPLAADLAARGWFVVIEKMPFNMAIIDPDCADKIVGSFPQVKSWYIAGHSMGGAAAAMYVDGKAGNIAGLILLAAYSTADLTDDNLDVLSIYGSNDGVLSMERYEKYRGNLPASTRELVIEGGNHAQFGAYGEQKGDNPATISAEEQWTQTADFISAN